MQKNLTKYTVDLNISWTFKMLKYTKAIIRSCNFEGYTIQHTSIAKKCKMTNTGRQITTRKTKD